MSWDTVNTALSLFAAMYCAAASYHAALNNAWKTALFTAFWVAVNVAVIAVRIVP